MVQQLLDRMHYYQYATRRNRHVHALRAGRRPAPAAVYTA
jgi:hypothetical protein